MRRWTWIGSLFAIVLFLTLTLPQAASAQDATPAADMSPNADECTLAPRNLEDLQGMVGTPFPEGAGEATSAANDKAKVPVELPSGTAADAATIDALTAAIHRQIACFNAGDGLSGFAGTTDEFIKSQVGLALFDQDLIAFLTASPVALSEEQQTVLLGVREAMVYSDGRVGALVDYMGNLPPGQEGINGVETDLWIFEKVGDEWLLDESIQDLEAEYGPPGIATPTA